MTLGSCLIRAANGLVSAASRWVWVNCVKVINRAMDTERTSTGDSCVTSRVCSTRPGPACYRQSVSLLLRTCFPQNEHFCPSVPQMDLNQSWNYRDPDIDVAACLFIVSGSGCIKSNMMVNVNCERYGREVAIIPYFEELFRIFTLSAEALSLFAYLWNVCFQC